MKPKPLSKALERRMRSLADGRKPVVDLERWVSNFVPRDARAILAALKYERQRADDAEKRLMAVPPQYRNGMAALVMREMMGPPSEERPTLIDAIMDGEAHVRRTIAKHVDAAYRKRKTEAVVPNARKRR